MSYDREAAGSNLSSAMNPTGEYCHPLNLKGCCKDYQDNAFLIIRKRAYKELSLLLLQ